jgi:hypothetical protein
VSEGIRRPKLIFTHEEALEVLWFHLFRNLGPMDAEDARIGVRIEIEP